MRQSSGNLSIFTAIRRAQRTRVGGSSNMITSLLWQSADFVMLVTSLNRKSSTYARLKSWSTEIVKCWPKKSSWVWCCLQPQQPSQRLLLLPTHLAALTSNVTVALHRLSDVRRTAGRLVGLPLSQVAAGSGGRHNTVPLSQNRRLRAGGADVFASRTRRPRPARWGRRPTALPSDHPLMAA